MRELIASTVRHADFNQEGSYAIAEKILSLEVKGKTLKEWIELLEQGKLAILDDDQSLPPTAIATLRTDVIDLRDNEIREARFKKVK